MRNPYLTPEVIVDPKEKLVIVTPELERAIPQATSIFEAADYAFVADSEKYLEGLEESLFTFKSSTGANIDCSLIPGRGSEMLVMWAPFSDSAPRSSAEDMFAYISNEKIGKGKAAPNSWNQITKSSVVSELLSAAGREMPVLTIFSPLPSFPHNAYTSEEYKKIRRGDFSPSARIMGEATQHAQDRLHGKTSETQIDGLHLHGASLGASTVIGAAIGNKAVRSVTAQELIVAPKNVVPDLGMRFMLKDPIGQISDKHVSDNWRRIPEPFIRRKIDSKGNEPMMVGRMILGMSKLSRLKGLTRPEQNMTPKLVEELTAAGVSVLIPLAENSGLTHDTREYLPKRGEFVVNVRATKGERTAHLIDEHVALTALMAVLNIRQTKK